VLGSRKFDNLILFASHFLALTISDGVSVEVDVQKSLAEFKVRS
jgi:hypothetical protein